MGKLTVVINTLNEEKNIKRAISSVKSIADEIVVVDMMSGDRTKEIAKEMGAVVYDHEPVGYVEPARNFAISKASNDWVFILDADEEIPSELGKKIKQIIQDGKGDYFRIPRKNINFGKWIKHSRWWPDYNIRFFKKGCVSWNEVIHSVPMTTGQGIELEAEERYAIVHHNYSDINEYIERLNRYTDVQSKFLQKKGYKFVWKDLISKPVGEFLGRYFSGEGYKDGLHGFALSVLQGFSEFVTYLKVWQLEKFEEKQISPAEMEDEVIRSGKEIMWWVNNRKINSMSFLPKLFSKIIRKVTNG